MPRLGRIVAVIFRIGELFHFRVQPFAAACLDQLLQHLREDFGQVRHIADCVFDLPVGQRAAAPVSEACALVDCDAEPALDQIGVTDLFALADCHHRDLGIENGMGRLAGQIVDNLNVLAAGVKYLQHVFIVAHQVQQARQVDAVCQRIDCGRFFIVGDLHQAEFRPIRVLAHEFRIDGDEVGFFEARDQIVERFGRGNQIMYFHRTFLYAGGVPPLGIRIGVLSP